MVQLILLRHGESIWNRDNRFTGWTDVDLSDQGVGEAHRAAALLKAHEIVPELVLHVVSQACHPHIVDRSR
jgi:bisphosphoglycerate-dependent phosphoglycerate mutase